MSTSRKPYRGTALVIGVGGLGCPAALALARAGGVRLLLADDDVVELPNLHRQILFDDADIGTDKLDTAKRVLDAEAPGETVELVRSRFLPDNARALAGSVDVVVEGADNYATKFLASDACFLERTPVVHGSAIRWHATVWAVAADGAPCYRCLFEDVPGGGAQDTCAEAGVMGPLVGFAGALMADRALRILDGDPTASGAITTYDGRGDRLRSVPVAPRRGCPLCDTREIETIDEARYTGRVCAA